MNKLTVSAVLQLLTVEDTYALLDRFCEKGIPFMWKVELCFFVGIPNNFGIVRAKDRSDARQKIVNSSKFKRWYLKHKDLQYVLRSSDIIGGCGSCDGLYWHRHSVEDIKPERLEEIISLDPEISISPVRCEQL